MDEQKLETMREKYLNPLAQYKIGYQMAKIIIALLILCLLASLAVNFALAKKQQLIVGIDANMLPVPLRVKKMNLENLIDYKGFITSFLIRAYYWDVDNYQRQIGLALDLMAPEIREQFREVRLKGSYPELVADGKMAQALKIVRIGNDVKKYKDGYMVDVDAIKMRLLNQAHDLTEPVKFHIAFRRRELSPVNFWGFEVFELIEVPIVDNTGKAGRE